ncbi:hypothetical protein DL93DRAFT_1739997 [Clavulina sp. PMI_390]|nr:hypothetical protein DL93DRAFT_1739997 [Clavulina sp. PMI_390]
MEIEEIMPPVGSMGRGVNDLFWATERSTAWLGINAHGDRGGFVEEWDVAQAKAQALGSVQLCGNALTVHQFSPNVVLAEVEDLDMQFVLHDWRTPRATQRFGYDSSFDSIAHLRGDVRGNLFARGDTNGNVRIWDIRNLDGYQSVSLSPGDCITQVVFDPFAEGPDRLISLLDQNEVIFTTLLHT